MFRACKITKIYVHCIFFIIKSKTKMNNLNEKNKVYCGTFLPYIIFKIIRCFTMCFVSYNNVHKVNRT